MKKQQFFNLAATLETVVNAKHSDEDFHITARVNGYKVLFIDVVPKTDFDSIMDTESVIDFARAFNLNPHFSLTADSHKPCISLFPNFTLEED